MPVSSPSTPSTPAGNGFVGINVVSQGAVGDGVTDNRTLFNTLLAQGHSLWLPAGTYYVSDYITALAGQIIRGEGIGVTTLLGAAGNDIVRTIESFVSMEGMTIRGPSSGSKSNIGIKTGVDSVTIAGNSFTAKSLEVKWCEIGYYNGKYDGNTLTGVTCHFNTKNVVSDGNVAPLTLNGCVMNDSTGNSIEVLAGASFFWNGGNLNNVAIGGGYGVFCDTGGIVGMSGVQMEVVGNGADDSIYIYGNNNAKITMVGCEAQNGFALLRYARLNAGARGVFIGCGANSGGTDGAHILLAGTGTAEGLFSGFIATYNLVAQFIIGDYTAQTGDNALPAPSVLQEGKKVLLLNYGSWDFPEVMFQCLNVKGSYAWVPIAGGVSKKLLAQTAAVSSIVAGGGLAGTYRVSAWLNVTAISTDVIQLQVTYTDENSVSQTQILATLGATPAVTISATGSYVFPTFDIRSKDGTAITLKTVLTVGGGSITYDVGGEIQMVGL